MRFMRKILIIFILLLTPSSFILADTKVPDEPISKEQAIEIVKNTLKGPNSNPENYTYDVTFRTADEARRWVTNPHNNPTPPTVVHDQWVVTIQGKDYWHYLDFVDVQTGKIDCRMGTE